MRHLRFRSVALGGAFVFIGLVSAAKLDAHQPHDLSPLVAFHPDPGASNRLWAGAMTARPPRRVVLVHSEDGGYSWKRIVRGFDERQSLSGLCVSPGFGADGTIVTTSASDGARRSVDGGVSFEDANDGLPSLQLDGLHCGLAASGELMLFALDGDGRLMRSDDAAASWTTAIDRSEIASVGLSPDFGVSGRVYAGTHAGRLLLSEDFGASWRVDQVFPGAGALTQIAVADSTTLFIGTELEGLLRSEDGGFSYESIALMGGVVAEPIVALAVSPAYGIDRTLFAATPFVGVFRSTDGGDRFDRVWSRKMKDGADQTDQNFRSIVLSPNYAADATLFVGMFSGLWSSQNGGDSWIELDTIPAASMLGLGLSPQYSTDGSLGLARYGGGVSTSDDNAETWNGESNGFEDPFTYHLLYSPDFAVDGTIFSSHNAAVVRSLDRGATWRATRLAGFPSALELSPGYGVDGTLLCGTRGNGVFRSIDRGRNWQRVAALESRVSSIGFSPDFLVDGQAWFAARGGGVYESEDGGATWVETASLPSDRRGALLVVSPNHAVDSALFAGTLRGLHRSSDGGESWRLRRIAELDPDHSVEWVALSPDFAVDSVVIVSMRGEGLYKSDDGGASWREVGDELMVANRLLIEFDFSPGFAVDRTLVGMTEDGLFHSTDGGESWQEINRGPIRFQTDGSQAIRLQGGGWQLLDRSGTSAHSIHVTAEAGDRVNFRFTGESVAWIGARGPSLGVADVYLDDTELIPVDQYSAEWSGLERMLSITDLEPGPHLLTLVATDRSHPDAVGTELAVDAFEVE